MLTLLTTTLFAPYLLPPTQAPNWISGSEYIAQILSTDQIPTTTSLDSIRIPASITPLNKLVGTLNGYGNLPEDWDGYGGVPPMSETVSDASNVVSLLPREVPLPKPMLSGNGNIGLYWKTDDLYLDIEFEGDGTFSYYAEKAGVEPLFDDMISVATDKLPEELEQLLFSLSPAQTV